MSDSLVINSVEPLEKRPCHPMHAISRGLPEHFEPVFVIRGFSLGGHIHAPIVWEGRYFKPFTAHRDGVVHVQTVQVMLDDPANPYTSGDIAANPGILKNFENVAKVRRPSSNAGSNKKPLWILRTLVLTIYDPATKTTRDQVVENALAWRSGSEAGWQPSRMTPFSVKAVELTVKEIDDHHAKLAKRTVVSA